MDQADIIDTTSFECLPLHQAQINLFKVVLKTFQSSVKNFSTLQAIGSIASYSRYSQVPEPYDQEILLYQPISSQMCPQGSLLTPQKTLKSGKRCNPFISGWARYLYFQAVAKNINPLRIGVEKKIRALECVASSHQWGQVPELSLYLIWLIR